MQRQESPSQRRRGKPSSGASEGSARPAFDRTPPQNIEAERSVLGAMLLNPDAVGTGIEILHDDPEIFYADAHQHIYRSILTLFRQGIPIDSVTLLEQLQRDGTLESAGGATYLAELVNAVPTSANIEYYARIVLDTALLRKIIITCTRLAGEAYDSPPDVNALLDRVESNIFSIAQARQLNPIVPVADLLMDAVGRIEEIITSHKGITGLATGFARLDELTSGFQPSDMIVIAARPSVGKTAFALNIACHAAVNEGKSALIFSLEMSKEQLVQRLLCLEGQIDSQRLRTGFLADKEFPKLQHAADRLSRAKLFIDDTPNITVLELRSKLRRHKAQHDLDLVIIDYLQLMSSPGRSENRQVEIAEISRSLKGIARELRVPVVALSQLSREAEKDDEGIPKLFHLRESGAIEQDADVVLMLSPMKREDNENLIKVQLAKQRNGPVGNFELLFERHFQKFKNVTFDPDLQEAQKPLRPPLKKRQGWKPVPQKEEEPEPPDEEHDEDDEIPF